MLPGYFFPLPTVITISCSRFQQAPIYFDFYQDSSSCGVFRFFRLRTVGVYQISMDTPLYFYGIVTSHAPLCHSRPEGIYAADPDARTKNFSFRTPFKSRSLSEFGRGIHWEYSTKGIYTPLPIPSRERPQMPNQRQQGMGGSIIP